MPRFFEQCPKCDHAPLPAEQALPAACPACGLILAKFAALSSHDDDAQTVEIESVGGYWVQLRELMFHVPERVSTPTLYARALLWIVLLVWGARLIALDHRTGEINGSFLHGPLLVFHEAGHVIFSVLGEFMMIFGGTFAQLLLPAIIAGAFLIRNRDPFAAAVGTWLLGVSVLDVAPYVFDALEPKLILLGGHTGEEGGHDWIYLLGETGLTDSAHMLGWLAHKLGAVVVLGALTWAGWILFAHRQRIVA